MKIKEMQQICSKHNHNCRECKLYYNKDWYEQLGTKNFMSWCFKDLAIAYYNKYKMHIDRGEKEKAEETLKEYLQLEEKYEINK